MLSQSETQMQVTSEMPESRIPDAFFFSFKKISSVHFLLAQLDVGTLIDCMQSFLHMRIKSTTLLIDAYHAINRK